MRRKNNFNKNMNSQFQYKSPFVNLTNPQVQNPNPQTFQFGFTNPAQQNQPSQVQIPNPLKNFQFPQVQTNQNPQVPDPQVQQKFQFGIPNPQVPNPQVPNPQVPNPQVPNPQVPNPQVQQKFQFGLPNPQVPNPQNLPSSLNLTNQTQQLQNPQTFPNLLNLANPQQIAPRLFQPTTLPELQNAELISPPIPLLLFLENKVFKVEKMSEVNNMNNIFIHDNKTDLHYMAFARDKPDNFE